MTALRFAPERVCTPGPADRASRLVGILLRLPARERLAALQFLRDLADAGSGDASFEVARFHLKALAAGSVPDEAAL